LALHPPRQSAPDPIEQAIRAGISRITSTGMDSTVRQNGESILQEKRTFKLKLPSPSQSYWSSTYRLQFSAGGLQDVIHVGIGLAKRGIDDQIKKVNLPRLVPSLSNARILRDAVVSCSSGQSE